MHIAVGLNDQCVSLGGGGGGGGGVERDKISEPLKIKYQISDPSKNQISDITRSQKIRYLA